MMSTALKVKFSDVNGIKLAYTETGAGNPVTLLFIHGLGENMQTWVQNIASLQNRFYCIAIDLPGHGQSQSGDYLYTPYFFAETIVEFLKQQNLQQVNLVGHSLGGQVAILLSISNPSLVDKLVLIAPSGFEQFTVSDKKWIEGQAQNYLNSKAFDFMSYMPGYQSGFPSNDVYKATIKGMLGQPVFEHLKLITQPTLIIFGENDPLIPNRFIHPKLTSESVAKTGAAEIKGSRLIMIPNAGHFVHIERVGEVDKEVKGFVD